MSETMEIGGFAVSLEGDEAVCRLLLRDDLGVEPPADQEEQLSQAMAPGGSLAGKLLVISLEGIPAVSSRQLGSMLSLYRAAGLDAKIAVRGIRPNVRELFKMTKMDQFFGY